MGLVLTIRSKEFVWKVNKNFTQYSVQTIRIIKQQLTNNDYSLVNRKAAMWQQNNNIHAFLGQSQSLSSSRFSWIGEFYITGRWQSLETIKQVNKSSDKH